jgi:hypothetical protein
MAAAAGGCEWNADAPPPPLLDEQPVRAGDSVWTQPSPIGDVGLWLFYEDRCDSDITYYGVPGGTPAMLTGDFCFDDRKWYGKLSFSEEQKAQYKIGSENTWLPLAELDRKPPVKSSSP